MLSSEQLKSLEIGFLAHSVKFPFYNKNTHLYGEVVLIDAGLMVYDIHYAFDMSRSIKIRTLRANSQSHQVGYYVEFFHMPRFFGAIQLI